MSIMAKLKFKSDKFSNKSINLFCFKKFILYLFIFFHIKICLKVYHLNIIKKIMKNYKEKKKKRKKDANERYQYIKKNITRTELKRYIKTHEENYKIR